MGKKKTKKDLDDAFFADFADDGLENGADEDAANASPVAPGTSACWRRGKCDVLVSLARVEALVVD